MNPRRLLRTFAVRLALRYALFYTALVALALGLLYWSTSRFVDNQLAAGLRNTADALERAHGELAPREFQALVKAELRAGRPSKLHLLLADANGLPLSGDFTSWPPGLSADNEVHNMQIEDELIDTARTIGAGRLNRRIRLSGQGDEFDELAEQLNGMLDRIGNLMAGMRQGTDNVAHDLRRPLSRVRNLLAQATGNLLDNALKFTPPGTPLRLEVSDKGGTRAS